MLVLGILSLDLTAPLRHCISTKPMALWSRIESVRNTVGAPKGRLRRAVLPSHLAKVVKIRKFTMPPSILSPAAAAGEGCADRDMSARPNRKYRPLSRPSAVWSAAEDQSGTFPTLMYRP